MADRASWWLMRRFKKQVNSYPSTPHLIFHSYLPGSNLLFDGGEQQSGLQGYLLSDTIIRLVSFAAAT
jgi:hypothetical protein